MSNHLASHLTTVHLTIAFYNTKGPSCLRMTVGSLLFAYDSNETVFAYDRNDLIFFRFRKSLGTNAPGFEDNIDQCLAVGKLSKSFPKLQILSIHLMGCYVFFRVKK